MQVTVNIPDELAAQAVARGSSPESYVETLLAARTTSRNGPMGQKDLTPEEFNAILDSLAKYSEKIPDLQDEALTRASFYQDHD